MSLDPGQRSTMLRLMRRAPRTGAQATAGEHVEFCRRWARLKPLSGNEVREAGAASDAAELELIVLADSKTRTLTTADAVEVTGRRYGIVTLRSAVSLARGVAPVNIHLENVEKALDVADQLIFLAKVAGHLGRMVQSWRDEGLARDIVVAMRLANSDDTGRLDAGIVWRRDGPVFEVSATARRGDEEDYAPFVQYGRKGWVTPGDLDRAATVVGALDPVDFFWGPGLELVVESRRRIERDLDSFARENS